jgi:hypothetical protein
LPTDATEDWAINALLVQNSILVAYPTRYAGRPRYATANTSLVGVYWWRTYLVRYQ